MNKNTMKINRKKICVLLVLLLLLILVGYLNGKLTKRNQSLYNEAYKNNGDLKTIKDDQWGNVSFEGVIETTENPWGVSAGIIEFEGDKCIFLTPNSSVTLDTSDAHTEIEASYSINPLMKDVSDGAGLRIWYLNKENEIVKEESFHVTNDSKKMAFDTDKDEGIYSIKIICNNGGNNDDNGDWVLIRPITDLNYNYAFGEDGFVKSATYFADEWPINFWNSEMDNLSLDMKQISSDGFNSIIIVVPWREFQPSVDPVIYNEYAFDNLQKVMRAAQDAHLDVYARIGYTWDYYNDLDENIVDRYCNILNKPTTREAWIAYVGRMYEVLNTYSCFKKGFVTWEDFWNTLGVCDEQNEENRKIKAKEMGYQSWVIDNYKLNQYNQNYGTKYNNYEEIMLPIRTDPAMKAMYEFYDNFLIELLADSQQVFPDLSMEVRLDWDSVHSVSGDIEYYKHNSTFECGQASFTSAMYGIPMGFENKGEVVSANEAIEKTTYILKTLKENNNNKSVYVEQFIFADNTPAFKNNARIKEDELNKYLCSIADVLLDNTEGYGIWTYKNYRANMVYNSQFYLGELGWDYSKNVEFNTYNESHVCKLEEGGSITQHIPEIRNHFDKDKYVIEFDVVQVLEPGRITILFGDEKKSIFVDDIGKVKIDFPKPDQYDVSISVEKGTVAVDNINVYSQVQQGYIYDEYNNELSCANGIRELNARLKLK